VTETEEAKITQEAAAEAEVATEETAESEEEARDEVEVLHEAVEEAQAQAAEYLDGWQRAQAEFANYRKRQESERARMIARANEDVLRKILPVVDDFERAMDNLPDEIRESPWFEGVLMLKHKLEGVLESEGVTSMETKGQVFDPRYHEAVTYEEAPGYEEGQIIAQAQRGYLVGERVLRPALVRVAKASVPEVEEESDQAEDKE